MPEPLRAGSPASGPDGLSPTRFYDPVRVELEELLAEGDLESALVTVPRPRKPDPAAPLPNSSPPLPSFDVPQIGTVIAETYRVVSELGRGAMGVVLLAEDQRLGRKVAIKLIQETLVSCSKRASWLSYGTRICSRCTPSENTEGNLIS